MKSVHSNNENIFLAWYQNHNDGIFRFCLLKTSNRNVALDLTQETFCKLWEYFASGREIEEPKALLYRIASNLIIDYYRKKKSDSLDVLQEIGFDPQSEDQSIDPQKQALMGELHKNLSLLEEKYKDILIMRFINDMSVKEIAAVYDEHENTISVRIHRAIDKLKKIYNE